MVWLAQAPSSQSPNVFHRWPLWLILIPYFLPFPQASFSSSMLHFMPFWQPCLAAACFASCGPLVPTTQRTMTESCHQVNKSPLCSAAAAPPPLTSFCLSPLLKSQHSWLSLCLHWQVWRWRRTWRATRSPSTPPIANPGRSTRGRWMNILDVSHLNGRGMHPQLPLSQFPPFGSCNACWERKPFCGLSVAVECVFF